MSAVQQARPDRAVRTRPTTVGWIAIIVFAVPGRPRRHPRDRRGRRVHLARVRTSIHPSTLTNYVLPEETIIYDRTGKIELARFGEAKREVVTFDQIPQGPARRDDRGRGQDLLGQRRLRPGRDRVGRPELAPRRQPWRVDDHPAARPGTPARPGARPGPAPDGRAQAQGDHPVDPADRGLPGRRRASSRSSPPTSTRTTTATRPTA